MNQVKKMARTLGADVPVCLTSQSSLVGGIGNRVDVPPPLPPLGIVMVNSGAHVSTEEAYHRLNWKRAVRKGSVRVPDNFADSSELITFLKKCRNDLQEPAIEIAPEIEDVLDELSAQRGCRLARVLGSGGTCFGLFGNKKSAEKAGAQIAADNPDWWVSVTYS